MNAKRFVSLALVLYATLCAAPGVPAATVILPQQRGAFYVDESVEIAVAGLEKGVKAAVDVSAMEPGERTLAPVRFDIVGDGSTVVHVLPAGSLAPGRYAILLDGREAARIAVASGVADSTFLISQTINRNQLEDAGANFIVGNAFNFGRFSPDRTGPQTTNLRANRSAGLSHFEQAIEMDLPTVVYMYWTGYVTHKPFGSKKSWAARSMTEAMRLLSFHTAQRLKRYGKNIVSVGTIDEPGLGWGKTPAGGTASGFPDWDEEYWYEERGWDFTNDPAARPDDDWMKYMRIRCGIMAEQQGQARKDLKAIWPDMVFSTDLYAPHAIMDGTDPLSQTVNDIPSSHVFVDWGIDRLGAYSGVMLEKSHAPTTKLAHAMNGQLFAERVPQPQQTYAYRVCLNGMLAAGLASNWWLNTGGMTPADLKSVNEPAKRVGALLAECEVDDRDVAVLWSFTEIAMREKAITAKEASKKTGEQIKLMVASLPENTAIENKELSINAYNIGGDYKETVLTAHYACSRAGYPAHIVHERILPGGILKNYKTLVIAGQTFELPKDVMAAIGEFVRGGGRIVVDSSTTVSLEGAIPAEVDLKGLSYRWTPLFTQDAESFKTVKEASYFKTNYFMDEPVRQAVDPFKAALERTEARPRIVTDSNELVVERHTAGDGAVVMAVNGNEQLPEIADDAAYAIYNYAPQQAKLKLANLPETCVVYTMEGTGWSKTRRLDDPQAEIDASFEPGEMKLFVIAPREPAGLEVVATGDGTGVAVSVKLKDLNMAWPLEVALSDAAGKTLYRVHRATGTRGEYEERFPLGGNAPAGNYTVRVTSPLAGLAASADVNYQPKLPAPEAIAQAVRFFDEKTIAEFLQARPKLVVVHGNDAQKQIAEQLAAALAGKGMKTSVAPAGDVLKKVAYPRVWNPYATVVRPTGAAAPLDGKPVEQEIMLATTAAGEVTIKTADGEDLSDWKQPKSLVTIAGEGYADWIADDETCYEPGVKLYVDENRRVSVVLGEREEVRTTPEFRARWATPWTTLTTHVGGYQLPPQLPEAYTAEDHLIVLGESTTNPAAAVLQASDLVEQIADEQYPGPGKALVSLLYSPFAVEKNVIFIGASDEAGLKHGAAKVIEAVR